MRDPLNDSYYRATAHAWAPSAREIGDTVYDVCVIGGGFTGLAAALAAAESGFSVILLEARSIGFGASGRNGGQLIPGLRWSMGEIDAAFGRPRAKALFDLAWGAVDRVRARIEKHRIACDLKPGHLEAAFKPAHFDAMQREADVLAHDFGYTNIAVVPRADLPAHVGGGDYHGGLYDHGGGHFHPLNYALGLARAAADAGVTIVEHAPVRALAETGAVSVQLAGRTVRARHAVIATDTWTQALAPHLGRFTVPIMNYNVATVPLGDVAGALLPSDAAVADSRFVLNYFRLSADRRLIFGGGERYTQTPPRDIAAFVRPFIARVFPSIANVPIDYAWGGAVGVTMNRLPHIGRAGNIFHAHGFSGHGAALTTLAGELIAEALRGTAERFDLLASLPHRPFPGGPALARPLATLGLLWHALRDRL